MENSSTYTMPETGLRTVAEKVALGWDYDSMEQRMTVRLEKIRRQNRGEGSEGNPAPHLSEKEHLRS